MFHVVDLAKKNMAVDETGLLFVADPTSISYCDREQFLLYKGIHNQTVR
jgi:hypothetical protein